MLLSYAHNYQVSEETLPYIRRAILHDVLLGRISMDQALPSAQGGPYQVLLLRACSPDQVFNTESFLERFHFTGRTEHYYDMTQVGNDIALLLYGETVISSFNEHSMLANQKGSMVNRALHFPEPVFLASGRIVNSSADIPLSYQDALGLLKDSFFCNTEQLLRFEDMPNRASRSPAINALLLEKYVDKLMQSMQAFNRPLIYTNLCELEATLTQGCDTPEDIRLFYADLYLQIKEQMRYLYQGYTIPFYPNSYIIKTIMEALRLSDITFFLVQRFDMIMSYIGTSSQDGILGSILHYIKHNYTSNITLESIAPLFGYNHSYLGKIFRKKVGVPFNEYIDRLRIEMAKTLLLQDDTKVYLISKQVGYKNVDYFHVKFRKYVDLSPAEYRKIYKDPSHSPEKENVEKGTLFHA